MEHIDLRRGVTTAVCIWPEGDKERAILKEQDSGIFFWHTEKVNQREQDSSEKEKMV